MAVRDKTSSSNVAQPRLVATTRAKQPNSIARNITFVFFAAGLAGLATYVSRVGYGGTTRRYQTVTSLPDSYAICTEPGLVYTVDESRPNADCLLVTRDRIAAAGTLEEIQTEWDVYQTELVKKFYGGEPKAKKSLQVIRPPSGSIITPGFADAHAHLMMYGAKMELNLEGAESIDEVLDRIERYVAIHPTFQHSGAQWIAGFGWDQTRWTNWRGGFPSKSDLESRPALAGLPMALSRVDGHALWVSQRALEITEVALPGRRWPGEIEGGEIMKDERGEPTGVLLDSAMTLIPVPPPSEAQMTEQLERAVKDALVVGLTSVHDAAVNRRMLEVFKKMADDGRLPIRVYAMANEDVPEYWGSQFERLEEYGRDGTLNLRSVKLFTDGALGSWGAALLEPYSDNPGTSGFMPSTEEALKRTVTKFWNDGWDVNIHCIGDRANKAVLDIFEGLLPGNEIAVARRPRIEHAQIMRHADLTRAGKLGVITSVQPTHATSDMWYAESRLGPDRIVGAYAYQTLLQSSPKKVLPLGSDFPVEGINPLLGFYAAVSRLDVRGESPHGTGGWFPSERLTRAQALKGMTYDAAYASLSENDLGSLSVGKKADYVLLDRNIMNETTALADILAAQVRATVVGGRVLYGGI